MSAQLALDGRDSRVRTYLNKRCLCYPCWCARCVACGQALTKHDFTEESAASSALDALDRHGHFQHRCPA